MERRTPTETNIATAHAPRLLTGHDRVVRLRRIRGMWKDRTPAPIQELEAIRDEWERDGR